MNREQVKQLFQLLGSTYPNFMPDSPDKLKTKIDTWTDVMKDMDFDRVMVRAREHIQTNKFPPTVAEISAFAPKKSDTLEKMDQWEQEAKKVPQEVKDEFRRKFTKLFEDKSP